MPERIVNPYLIKDLEKRLRTDNLFSWIDAEAERVAHYGLKKSVFVDYTTGLMNECRIHSIIPITKSIAGEDAYIKSQSGKYVIYIKKGLPETRRRFVIAHEIGHTYWLDESGNNYPVSALQLSAVRNLDIEYLCDRFAASLLMPHNYFLQFINKYSRLEDIRRQTIPPLDLIPILSKQFHVAEQAIAKRLFFEMFPRKIVILCIQNNKSCLSLFNNELPNPTKWKIIWCALPAELHKPEIVLGIKIPFKTPGRIIPYDMIPNVSNSKTEEQELDGRYWDGIKGQHEEVAKHSLKRWPRNNSKHGYVSQHGNNIYIGLPF